MRESTLGNFLLGATSTSELCAGLADVAGVDTLHPGKNFHVDLTQDFQLTPAHLIKLCDEFLSGRIEAAELQGLAFFALGSDHFVYDTGTPEGDLVGQLFLDWSCPQINYPLTPVTITECRDGLLKGEYPYTRNRAS